MNKTKIITLLFLVSILLVTLVSAETPYNENWNLAYCQNHFAFNTTNHLDDGCGTQDLTSVSQTMQNPLKFEQGISKTATQAYSYPLAGVLHQNITGFSITGWFNFSTGTTLSLVDFGGAVGNEGFSWSLQNSGTKIGLMTSAPAQFDVFTPAVNQKTPHLYSITYNATNHTWFFYENATFKGAVNSPFGFTGATETLGYFGGGDEYVAGSKLSMDDVVVWNKTLSSTEIVNIYNGNFTVTPSLNISTRPLNNTQFNTPNISINATLVSPNGAYNCSLNLNGSLIMNWTNNVNTTTLINYTYIFPANDASEYRYSFNCSDGTGTLTTSTPNTFFSDLINPNITTNFINNRTFFKSNITGQFNFSDSFMLYRFNVTIDGVNIANKENMAVTNYIYNLSYNPSELTSGWHTLGVELADGHTAKEIPEYIVDTGLFGDYLKYTFDGGKYVKITKQDSSVLDEWKTTKLKDKYSFSLSPSISTDTYSFIVSSNSVLNIVDGGKKYKQYLIIDNHWIDFVIPKYPNAGITIIKTSDTIAKVSITNIDPKEKKIDFNSIGDLNIVNSNFTFYILNYTYTYMPEVVESQSHTTTFTINYTGSGLTNVNFSSYLLYNNTAKTIVNNTDLTSYITFISSLTSPLITSNTSESVPFNWTFGFSSGTTEYVTYNQTVFRINVNDCNLVNTSNGWTRALNITFFDEEKNNESYLVSNSTLHLDLSVWYETESVQRNFSYSLTGGNNYSICIYPNTSSYKTNAILEYFATNYANRKYYLDNFNLTNTTERLYLYHLNYSKASDIILSVYDKNTGTYVSGAYVKILRYYPESHSYKIVEIAKTDENGYSLAKMVLADVFYKFIVETNRMVRLNTEVQRILSTTKTIPITQGNALLDSWSKINDVSSTVGCVNATKTCYFTWSDSQNLVATASLTIFRLNSYGKTAISTQELSAATGTLSYTIVEPTSGNMYEAYGYIHTNTPYSLYDMGQAFLDFREGIEKRFGNSVILPILLLIIVMGAAFIDTGGVAVIVASLVGLIFAVILGFVPLAPITLVSIIIIGGIMIAKLRSL